MALKVIKEIGGIEIDMYAVITKFWHTKFESTQKQVGETELRDENDVIVINEETGEVVMTPVYEDLLIAYAQIEYFKDREYAHQKKMSTVQEVFMISGFNPNMECSVNAQLYNLLKEQIPEFKDAIDC